MLRFDLPDKGSSLVIRTDFSDDAAWMRLCQLIQEPQPPDGFRAYVECISDRSCSGITAETAVTVLSPSGRSFAFMVDTKALKHRDHPVLVVDLWETPGRTFRVIPSEAWGVENNLSLGNMDFSEFAESVDEDGVFRGFPRP